MLSFSLFFSLCLSHVTPWEGDGALLGSTPHPPTLGTSYNRPPLIRSRGTTRGGECEKWRQSCVKNDDSDNDGHEDERQGVQKMEDSPFMEYASTSSMLTKTISYAFVVLSDICISSITIVVTIVRFSFILPSFISSSSSRTSSEVIVISSFILFYSSFMTVFNSTSLTSSKTASVPISLLPPPSHHLKSMYHQIH